MAKDSGGFPTDETGRGMNDQNSSDPSSMGLSFDTGAVNEAAFRSSSYGWGKFSPTSQTQVISVDQIAGDPFKMCLGSPDSGLAGGPGGKVVHTSDGTAKPA